MNTDTNLFDILSVDPFYSPHGLLGLAVFAAMVVEAYARIRRGSMAGSFSIVYLALGAVLVGIPWNYYVRNLEVVSNEVINGGSMFFVLAQDQRCRHHGHRLDDRWECGPVASAVVRRNGT